MTRPKIAPMPNKPKTPLHSFRVEDELWEAAKAREPEERTIRVRLSAADGKDEALRKFLRRYVK